MTQLVHSRRTRTNAAVDEWSLEVTANGKRTLLKWAQDYMVLPTVRVPDDWDPRLRPGQLSLGSGAIIRRADMDAGAVTGNPSRYITDPAPDGTPPENSSLQHAYNIIADRGLEHFLTE